MNYNIHPIFVHFPVALLMTYAVAKIVPLKKWFPRIEWRQIEIALLSVGFVGGWLAMVTGESAEHLARPSHAIVEMHQMLGSISMFIFGALLAGEILKSLNFLMPLANVLTNPFLSKVLAFAGLISITLTGLLGGVMTYGPNVDPLAPFVLKLLGLQ